MPVTLGLDDYGSMHGATLFEAVDSRRSGITELRRDREKIENADVILIIMQSISRGGSVLLHGIAHTSPYCG